MPNNASEDAIVSWRNISAAARGSGYNVYAFPNPEEDFRYFVGAQTPADSMAMDLSGTVNTAVDCALLVGGDPDPTCANWMIPTTVVNLCFFCDVDVQVSASCILAV